MLKVLQSILGELVGIERVSDISLHYKIVHITHYINHVILWETLKYVNHI